MAANLLPTPFGAAQLATLVVLTARITLAVLAGVQGLRRRRGVKTLAGYVEYPFMNRSGTKILVGFLAILSLLATGWVTALPVDAAVAKCMGKKVTHPGTPGDDVLRGTSGNDVFLAGSGNDTIFGLGGNDRICAGPGDDEVRGGKGRDKINGGSGNDQIIGGKGRDRIFGGRGSDTLVGNAGNDEINGGLGTDSCVGSKNPTDCEPAAPTDTEQAPLAGCDGDHNGVMELMAGLAQRDREWAGGDLMSVVELPDGDRLFLFGDTLQGDVDKDGALQPGFRMIRNSALRQSGSCFTPIKPAGGAGWIPGATATTWLWPQDGVVHGDQLIVFLVEVKKRKTGVDGLQFEPVGGAVAFFDVDDLTEPTRLVRGTPHLDGYAFGVSAIEEGAFLHVYAHGPSPADAKSALDTGTFVARVRTTKVADFSQWRFWNGKQWQKKAERAAAISPHRLNVSAEPDGSFLGTTVAFGTKVITTSSARSVTGPFNATEAADIDLAPIWPDAEGWAYRPTVLPGADSSGGRTVAVNFMPWKTSDMLANVHLYGPRFVSASGLGVP